MASFLPVSVFGTEQVKFSMINRRSHKFKTSTLRWSRMRGMMVRHMKTQSPRSSEDLLQLEPSDTRLSRCFLVFCRVLKRTLSSEASRRRDLGPAVYRESTRVVLRVIVRVTHVGEEVLPVDPGSTQAPEKRVVRLSGFRSMTERDLE